MALKRRVCGYADCLYAEPLSKKDIRIALPFRRLRPLKPWMDEETITYMESFLTKHTVILEFGAGYSTPWFAEKSDYVYSVEENRFWYELITAWLTERGLDNVSLLKPEEIIPEDIMDFIIIDGGDRLSNTKIALKFVNKDSIIAIDDQRDDNYKSAGGYLESQGWSCIKTTGKQMTKFYKRSEKNA